MHSLSVSNWTVPPPEINSILISRYPKDLLLPIIITWCQSLCKGKGPGLWILPHQTVSESGKVCVFFTTSKLLTLRKRLLQMSQIRNLILCASWIYNFFFMSREGLIHGHKTSLNVFIKSFGSILVQTFGSKITWVLRPGRGLANSTSTTVKFKTVWKSSEKCHCKFIFHSMGC